MDINIVDLKIERDEEGKIRRIYTIHRLGEGILEELPLEEESGGTRKLFGCLIEILNCLSAGGTLIADELDPKLLRYIIELFTSPDSNKKGAQLLL